MSKRNLIIGSVVILIFIVILSVFLFVKQSEKKSEELVVERGEKVERIEGSKDFDERFIKSNNPKSKSLKIILRFVFYKIDISPSQIRKRT
jgi:predicted membrane protein